MSVPLISVSELQGQVAPMVEFVVNSVRCRAPVLASHLDPHDDMLLEDASIKSCNLQPVHLLDPFLRPNSSFFPKLERRW